MNDIPDSPVTEPPAAPRGSLFNRLRRDTGHEMVGGVAAGLGRELGIDPLLVRVLFVIAAMAGGAGLVLYAAGWMFIPADGSDVSGFGAEFKVQDDAQVRTVGLAIGAGAAAVAALGTTPWMFSGWGPFPFGLVAVGVLAAAGWWLYTANQNSASTPDAGVAPVIGAARATGTSSAPTGSPVPPPAGPGRRGSPALFAFTASLVVVALGAAALVSALTVPFSWTTYVSVALGVVALGTLVGTWWGRPGGLIGVGTVLSVVLLAGQLVPTLSVGQLDVTPRRATELSAPVTLGIGQVRVDLRDLDSANLTGRVLDVENGVGQVEVIVPRGLDVTVYAQSRLGTVTVFGNEHTSSTVGTGRTTSVFVSGDEPDAFRINATVKVGEVKVIRR